MSNLSSVRPQSLFCVLLFLAYANPASADNDPRPPAVTNASAKGLDQIVYKGLVGNALDGIQMDPSKRVSLQRTNAIISNTLSGRSLAALAGLSNPILLVGGLVWGVWAASNIQPEDDGAKAISVPDRAGGEIATQKGLIALLDSSPAANSPPAKPLPEAALAMPIPAAEPEAPPRVRSPVVKVWLPQRPSTMAVARGSVW